MMWIIRFHLLKSKHYNKIARICKKHGFIPRKTSSLIFAKAAVLHMTQKISWRSLGREFSVDHISLYRFYESAKKTDMLDEIFHVFLESRCALYIGNNKTISVETLNNGQDIYNLTKKEFKSMLRGL